MGEARRDGGGNGRFANRPYQMVVRGNEGWVPASARTTGGGGAMGPRMREDKGERRVTVIWMTDIFGVNR